MEIIRLPTEQDWKSSKLLFTYLQTLAFTHPGASGYKLAACLSSRSGMAFGVNSYKTSPLQVRYSSNPHRVHLHAEIEALSRGTRKCKGNVEGSTMYVVRMTKSGKVAMSKPCDGCIAALLEFGIDKVYHT